MTYDGHARMKTRHYPIEDANTYTTWNYNADDSIQNVTDPRGAETNFVYNSRGLVSDVTYAVPTGSNIPDPADVAFGYDAVGNRTSMTDGTGTHSYAYDELSRMTSETQNFSGSTMPDAPLSNNGFKIEYGYNLSGGLKFYKDPYGQQIDFTNDKTGKLTKVDGSTFGTGAGATVNYTDGIQYRAWGAVKQLNYKTDDNALVKMTYDNRQRTSQYEVATNVVSGGYLKKSTFNYVADSRPTSMTDVVNSSFNRSFQYDHVGRLSYNYIGNYPTQTSYVQTNQYDAFSNLTSRNTSHWYEPSSFTSTFVNGRETTPGVVGTTYDAAGNQLHTGTKSLGGVYQTRDFEAANRISIFTSQRKIRTGRYSYITSKVKLEHWHDGDGRSLKQTESVWDSVYNQWTQTKTEYQLWSSVLGSYLSEMTGTGKKSRTKVFAGGAVIAEQVRTPGAGGTNIDTVAWIHADPVTGSSTTVHKDGTEYYRQEYEPLGNQQVETHGEYEDFPDPPSYFDDSYAKADDPQWGCQTETAIGTPLEEQPIRCQLAAFQNGFYDIFVSWNEKGNAAKLVDSPIPSGGNSPSNAILTYAARATTKRFTGKGEETCPPGMIRVTFPDGRTECIKKPEFRVDIEIPGIDMTTTPGANAEVSNPSQSSREKNCDEIIAALFGGAGAVAATEKEPNTLLGTDGKKYPLAGLDRSKDEFKSGFHIYGDSTGTVSGVGLYVPANADGSAPTLLKKYAARFISGESKESFGYRNTFLFQYKNGLVMLIAHVAGGYGGQSGGNNLGREFLSGGKLTGSRNEAGSYQIGYIGGPGGNSQGAYIHSHTFFWKNGRPTDPDVEFCGR